MSKRSSSAVLTCAPIDLVAVAIGGWQVILAWTESGAGGFGSRIERADGTGPCCSFVEIGGVGPHVTAFNDGSVKPRTTYSYRVHARNASGDSSPSNVVELMTPPDETELPAD
jgi:hypothetical protein